MLLRQPVEVSLQTSTVGSTTTISTQLKGRKEKDDIIQQNPAIPMWKWLQEELPVQKQVRGLKEVISLVIKHLLKGKDD